MQKISPCLWFYDQAEEAVNFYTSIFKNSKIGRIARYDEVSAAASGRPKDSVLTITFEIEGQEFVALNGGPAFQFTEAISYMVKCDTQEELDMMWEKLAAGGQQVQCGWLKDKYGLSWQIVPTALETMLSDSDPAKSERVMKALLEMTKLDIAALTAAYNSNE